MRGRRRPSPKKDPPDPPDPPECPGCGERPPPTTTEKTYEDESGAVEGDVICSNCGETLIQGILLSEPDFV